MLNGLGRLMKMRPGIFARTIKEAITIFEDLAGLARECQIPSGSGVAPYRNYSKSVFVRFFKILFPLLDNQNLLPPLITDDPRNVSDKSLPPSRKLVAIKAQVIGNLDYDSSRVRAPRSCFFSSICTQAIFLAVFGFRVATEPAGTWPRDTMVAGEIGSSNLIFALTLYVVVKGNNISLS
jgi:hypothetical protein